MLSPELLIELKQILKDDFGYDAEDSELLLFAKAFMTYGELLAKIELGSVSKVQI